MRSAVDQTGFSRVNSSRMWSILARLPTLSEAAASSTLLTALTAAMAWLVPLCVSPGSDGHVKPFVQQVPEYKRVVNDRGPTGCRRTRADVKPGTAWARLALAWS